MFLSWIEKCDLLKPAEDTHILKAFPVECQRTMCQTVIGYLTQPSARTKQILSTPKHVEWAMESLGQAFALTIEDADVIKGAISVYEKWLGLTKNDVTDQADNVATIMSHNKQNFICNIIGHMTFLFNDRSDSKNEKMVETHVELCHQTLDIFLRLGSSRASELSCDTWDFLLRLVLGMSDNLLHGNKSIIAPKICLQLVRTVLDLFVRSLTVLGSNGNLWDLLGRFCQRWVHRKDFINQWNSAAIALTRCTIIQIYGPKITSSLNENEGKHCTTLKITWGDRSLSSLVLRQDLVAYAWYRFLHITGHPSHIIVPEAHYAAMKGVRKMAEKLLYVGQDSKSEQPNEHLNQENEVFAPPDVNTILRLLGPWLFDALLHRSAHFDIGKAEAISCLAQIMCHYGGCTKMILRPYSTRFFLAVRNAFQDENERVHAAAVYGCSRVFGSDGLRSLRGAWILAKGYVHSIDRLFNLRIKNSAKLEKFGGISVPLLRRAAIIALSSLYSTTDDQSLVFASQEKDTGSELRHTPSDSSSYSSDDILGLYNVLLSSASDPTNQQMALWSICRILEVEVVKWTFKQDVATSKVIELISAIGTELESRRSSWSIPVRITAVNCLRQLSEVQNGFHCFAPGVAVSILAKCGDFIVAHLKLLKSTNSLSPLEILLCELYGCIHEWIIRAPWILSYSVIAKIIVEITVQGMEYRSKPTLRHSVDSLVNYVFKSYSYYPNNDENSSLKSSLVSEKHLVNSRSRCVSMGSIRVFGFHNETIMTIIEQSAGSCIIIRNGSGHYAWSFIEKLYSKKKKDGDDIVEKQGNENSSHSTESINQECDYSKDPLLKILRHNAKSLTSWLQRPDEVQGTDELTPGEGNSGGQMDEDPHSQKEFLISRILQAQVQLQNSSTCKKELFKTPPCLEPKSFDEKDSDGTWQNSRMVMLQLGLLSSQAWDSVVRLEADDDFWKEIETLDKIGTRESYQVGVLYVNSKPSTGGKSHIGFETYQSESKSQNLDPNYIDFLNSMGWLIDRKKHPGLVDQIFQSEKTLYFATSGYEVIYNVSSHDISSRNEPKLSCIVDNIERSDVLVVWNNSHQPFVPGSSLWKKMAIPYPKSHVILVIDPLHSDYYRIRTYVLHSSTFCQPAFDNIEAIANGHLKGGLVLGPLQDNMVIRKDFMGNLVRQTAVYGARIQRDLRHATQEDKMTTSPRTTILRDKTIAAIISSYSKSNHPSSLYPSVFTYKEKEALKSSK